MIVICAKGVQDPTIDPGNIVWTSGSTGTGNGQFGANAQYVATDSIGNIFVSDTSNNRIQKFDGRGAWKWSTVAGTGNGQFMAPKNLVCDTAGNVVVFDSGNSRIQKISTTGAFVWNSGTLTGSPTSAKNNGMTCTTTYVYLVDAAGNLHQNLNSTGAYQSFNAWAMNSISFRGTTLMYTRIYNGQYVEYAAAENTAPIWSCIVANGCWNIVCGATYAPFVYNTKFIAATNGTSLVWSTDNSFPVRPEGAFVAPTWLDMDTSDNFVVTDPSNTGRVVKMQSGARFWGYSGSCYSAVFDPFGDVIVTDPANYRIFKLKG